MYRRYHLKNPINPNGLIQPLDTKLNAFVPPKDSSIDILLQEKNVKVTSLQNELQQLIAQAKTDYEVRLALNYASLVLTATKSFNTSLALRDEGTIQST